MEKFKYQLVFELKYNDWRDAFWLKIGGIFHERSTLHSYCGRVEGTGMVYYPACIEISLHSSPHNSFHFVKTSSLLKTNWK